MNQRVTDRRRTTSQRPGSQQEGLILVVAAALATAYVTGLPETARSYCCSELWFEAASRQWGE